MFEAIIAYVIGSFLIAYLFILTATEGYEDSSGFHYGKPKEQQSRNSTETTDFTFIP